MVTVHVYVFYILGYYVVLLCGSECLLVVLMCFLICIPLSLDTQLTIARGCYCSIYHLSSTHWYFCPKLGHNDICSCQFCVQWFEGELVVRFGNMGCIAIVALRFYNFHFIIKNETIGFFFFKSSIISEWFLSL